MTKSQTSVNLKEAALFSCLSFDEKNEILILMRELVSRKNNSERRSINGQNKQRTSHRAEAAI